MTASRADILRAGCLAAFLSVFPAAAQVPADNGPPSDAAAPAPDNAAVGAPPLRAIVPQPSAIEVNALGSPDGPPIGLYDATNGGLGSEIWSGSPRGPIEAMLARLPLATPVASIHALARRLLLTKAGAPVGEAPHAFQTVRIQALMDAGLVEDAATLATQAQLKDDPEFAQVQADAVLLGERTIDACGNATQARLSNADAFWIQLRAYCYAVGGQGDMLDLTRGVMKAQGTDDPAFEILLNDVLARKAAEPGEIRDPNALDIFLLRLIGLPVSPSYAAKFGLSASVLALRDSKNPPNARADAAEQVVHSGAVSAVELGVIADAQTFTPAQLADAATAAAGLPFFEAQALLRQAVAHATSPDAKAALLFAALQRGEKDGLLPVAAGLQASGAAAVKPDAAMRADAGLVARALLLAGNSDAAERWREVLDPNSDADRPLAAVLAVQLSLAAPNTGRLQRAQQALSWLAQNALAPQPLGGDDMPRFAALAIGICDALSEAVPADAKAQLPLLFQADWPGRKIAPATLKRLAEARGQAELRGEALLTILDAVGAKGPGDLTPEAVIDMVRALKAEGEGEAAHAFARDALLLYHPVTMGSFHLLPPPPSAPAKS